MLSLNTNKLMSINLRILIAKHNRCGGFEHYYSKVNTPIVELKYGDNIAHCEGIC